MTLDELLAREGIRDLVTRYNSYGDSGRFDSLWDLFDPDAVMEIRGFDGVTQRYTGLDAIKPVFTGTQTMMQDAAAARPAYVRHFTATHQIDLVDPDRAIGRCYFSVLVDHGLDHWGRYVDRYVRHDDRWRFQHRQVLLDGRVDHSRFS